jgi:uncharacterized membrane protein YjjP (DUF1212 family)
MNHSLPLDVRFLKRFTRRLHQAGVPAHQLEGMVEAIAAWLGYHCDIWSQPTAVLLTIRPTDEDEDHQHIPMQMIRLTPAAINLADTAELYGMGESLISGQLPLEEAFHKLKQDPVGPYPAALRLFSAGLISGSFAVMLSSSWQGCITAALAGMLVNALYAVSGKAQRAGGMEAIAAAAATLLVYAINSQIAAVEPAGVIMSGLIILVPGLGLTVAVTELSTDHLSSGSARLAGSLIVLLKLSLGVLIGTVIVGWLGWDQAGTLSSGLGMPAQWVQWPALLLSALSFGVQFNIRLKDIYLAVLAAFTGYLVSRAGVMLGGIEFGVMLAALAVALLGNALGRALKLPASLVRVPGIILLVPGALGYRTVTNVLLQGTPSSQETLILVGTMAIALVGGLLIGNTLVPPRRYL